MPIVVSRPGVFMLVAGLIIAAVLETLFGIRIALLLSGLFLVSVDLLYRRRTISEWRLIELIMPDHSGRFLFIPVWVIGLIAIGFALFS